ALSCECIPHLNWESKINTNSVLPAASGDNWRRDKCGLARTARWLRMDVGAWDKCIGWRSVD
ncbi:MAG TPA: hypothetical protein VET48_12815, partial [Steroidobacteraceae bacterium]|nr:hypothetical protein [Steroidobacteraceae bacterium]